MIYREVTLHTGEPGERRDVVKLLVIPGETHTHKKKIKKIKVSIYNDRAYHMF